MKISDSDMVQDPIFAMDTVLSGQWVLVDASNVKDENDRCQAISSLVEFIGGVALTSFSPFSPMLLKQDDDETTTMTVPQENGGVALVCNTKSDLFQAGVSITSHLQSAANKMEMTDSGILLPQSSAAKEEDYDIIDSSPSIAGIKSAIVIPFDTLLWKNAMVVFNDDHDGDEDEDLASFRC
mmetsp:Transcript_2745/g.3757  ORF Transcript_2745/g.3757 Transcript_2745/m.3757 type:complete len:182 (+) Transcript_2745:3-548(+)|eukprot:15350579-Ditylum_brightwellii.AAC.2